MTVLTVQDVKIASISKGKNSYQEAEVVYTTERGENKTKKVLSFANPAVFAEVSKIKSPTKVSVENSGAPYYNWTSLEFVKDDSDVIKAAANPRQGSYVDNRETADERARRQVMIVRQSSLAQAVASYGPGADVNDVLLRAQLFVDWVMDDGLQGVEEMG